MKEKEFHVRSQVTAAFCCHTPFLSHRWCSLILYFLAISCKRTRRSQAGLVAVTVIFSPISFETKKNHDLRARNAGVMVTCRHSLWVAFTCTQGDDPTLIHHPTPTWSPRLSQWDLLKCLWADFKWILNHPTSCANPLVSCCKAIQDCLSAVTGLSWQKWWGEQNDEMFPCSWDSKLSYGMANHMAHMPVLPRAASLAALASCSFFVSALSFTTSFKTGDHTVLSDLFQIFKFSYMDIYRHTFKVLLL